MNHYADAKSEVIVPILERASLAAKQRLRALGCVAQITPAPWTDTRAIEVLLSRDELRGDPVTNEGLGPD